MSSEEGGGCPVRREEDVQGRRESSEEGGGSPLRREDGFQ